MSGVAPTQLEGAEPTWAPEQAEDRLSPFRRALPALGILTLAMAAGFTMMSSFSTLQEAAKADLGLSDYALSMVQGVAAAVPMVLLSIPIGIAVDRVHRARMLIALAAVWTLGTLLTAFAGSATILFIARMLTAIGTTGALTAALSLGADLVGPAHRGRAALLTTLGKIIGTAAGFAVGGWLAGQLTGASLGPLGIMAPWRAVHVVLTLVSLALMVPLFFLREPARRETESAPGAPLGQMLGRMWARRGFLIPLFAGQLGVVMADASAGIWAAPVLSRNFGLTPPEFAGWLGGLLLITGLAGSVLGGVAADWGQRSGRRGGLLIGAVVAAALGVPAALFPILPDVTGFAIALGALMLAGTITGLIVSVALTVFIPNDLRGLTIGAFIAIAGLIGFGLAPTLVAAVSDLLGGEEQIALALAVVGVTVSLLAFLAFTMAMRRAPAEAI